MWNSHPCWHKDHSTSFPIRCKSPEVKLVNDKKTPFGMSCDDYSKIFNRLITVGKIFYPIAVSPKSFSNSYLVKKGGTLSIMCFLKFNGYDKLSRVAYLNFNPKDLRVNPLQGGGFNTEQVSSLSLPSRSKVLNQVDPMLTLGQYWLGTLKKVQAGL